MDLEGPEDRVDLEAPGNLLPLSRVSVRPRTIWEISR